VTLGVSSVSSIMCNLFQYSFFAECSLFLPIGSTVPQLLPRSGLGQLQRHPPLFVLARHPGFLRGPGVFGGTAWNVQVVAWFAQSRAAHDGFTALSPSELEGLDLDYFS
jgi:hypothetical protein